MSRPKVTPKPTGPLAGKGPIRPSSPMPSPPGLAARTLFPEAEGKWKKASDEWQRRTNGEMFGELLSRLSDLLDHYKIERNPETQWLALAMKLAEEYVPAFQLADAEAPRGRPTKWDAVTLAKLYSAVCIENLARKARGIAESDRDVCRLLATRAPWKTMGSDKVLYNQFVEAKKSDLVRLIENARADPRIGDKIFTFWDDL
jgi:hypothetical protein